MIQSLTVVFLSVNLEKQRKWASKDDEFESNDRKRIVPLLVCMQSQPNVARWAGEIVL